ncbi:MAG: TonB-dependent receptor [Pseudomonadota bacterium]
MHTKTFVPALLALAVSVALVSSSAWAMHETIVEVSVPLERQSAFSVTPAQARAELEKTPGGVTVVDARDYLNGRAGTMDDTLKLAAGVFIQSRFGSDEARVSIRGSGLQRTFHGRGLMLLQDGVPLNLADGGFDMQAVEPGATRYVEVQRGANALRYGSSTLGGAINYLSQTGRSAPALLLRAEAGSFDYQRYQIAAGGEQGDVDGYASFSHIEQDGFRDHARQRNGRFFGNLGFQLTPHVESRFYTTVVDTSSELPGNLSYADVKTNPRKAEAGSLNRDAKRDFQLYRLANRTAISHDDGGLTEVTSYAARKFLFHPLGFARIEQSNRDIGLGLRHSQPTQWLGRDQEQIVGVNWRRGLTVDEQCSYGAAPAGTHPCTTLTRSNKLTANNLELFGESRWTLVPGTVVSAGGQWTDAQRRVSPGDQPAAPFYQETYRRFSPKLGVLHQLTPYIALYANANGSFEPPSFSEGPAATGRPLKAQRATTYEVGTRGDKDWLGAQWGWDLGYYRAHVRNELLVQTPAMALPTTRNADKTLHQGIEAGLRMDSASLRLLASYLYNDFRFQSDPGQGNNRIAGVPEQVFTAETAYKLPGNVWVGPTLRTASRAFVDHANTLAAPGYAVYGLKMNQTLTRSVEWFVEARNLSDKRYAPTTGVILQANAMGSDAQFSPGEGRAVYIGASKAF